VWTVLVVKMALLVLPETLARLAVPLHPRPLPLRSPRKVLAVLPELLATMDLLALRAHPA